MCGAYPGGKMFVRVFDATIMFFFEFVLHRIRRGIPALPESLDEVVALFVVGELLKSRPLLIRDDPCHVLIQPLLVGLAQLDL